MERETYKKKIDELSSQTFNADQKILAKKMIDAAPDSEVSQWFQLIIQKVKLGFRFDDAPEVNQGAISIVKENKKLRINVGEEVSEDENKLIIGENYDALKNLLVIHRGLIDVIYIDPPYNTEASFKEKNNLSHDVDIEAKKFIYRDKFTRTGWLNMMKERLLLAKELLSSEGVIFVSIDDSEQAYLKILMDEIFGEENFIENLVWQKFHATKANTKYFSNNHEYILCYARKKEHIKINLLERTPEQLKEYKNLDNDPRGPWSRGNMLSPKYSKSNDFEFINEKGVSYKTKQGTSWRFGYKKMKEMEKKNRLKFEPNSIRQKRYLNEVKSGVTPSTLLFHNDVGHTQMGTEEIKEIFNDKRFDFPKPVKLVSWLISRVNTKDSLILDFFAGSGTVGQAVMQLNREDGGNRKFILVTNNENNIALDVTYERLFRIINGETTSGKQDFKWLNKNKPFTNTALRVFNIKQYSCSLETESSKLKDIAKKELPKLNPQYKWKDSVDIYYDLNSLHPYREEK